MSHAVGIRRSGDRVGLRSTPRPPRRLVRRPGGGGRVRRQRLRRGRQPHPPRRLGGRARRDGRRQGGEGRAARRARRRHPARARAPRPTLPDDADLLVVSPGWKPTAPLLEQARARGVPVWGEVELAWRLRDAGPDGRPAPWLAVTGTNGKTTTVQMLDSILRAAGPAQRRRRQRRPPARRGGDGPDAVRRVRRGAVELPAPLHRLDERRVRGRAQRRRGPPRLVRRAARHGRLRRRQGPDLPAACSGPASTTSPTPRPSVWCATPTSRRVRGRSASPSACRAVGMVGVVDDILVDRAFIAERQSSAAELCTRRRPGQPGAPRRRQRAGRRRAGPGPRRTPGRGARRAARLPASTATGSPRSPPSTASPTSTTPRPPTPTPRARRCWPTTRWSGSPAVWRRAHASTTWSTSTRDRLRAAVLLGRDRDVIAEALARHAPDVPVIRVDAGETGTGHAAMERAVVAARGPRPAGRHGPAGPGVRLDGHVHQTTPTGVTRSPRRCRG